MSVKIYPDITGTKPEYLAPSEMVAIPENRVVMPSLGVFYADSIVMKNPETNQPLVRGVDFVLAEQEKTITAKSAKVAVLFIVFINDNLPPNIEIVQYQFVGGIYIRYFDILKTLIPDLNPDFGSIHDGDPLPVADVLPIENILRIDESSFSVDYAIWAINRISQALLIGNEEDHQQIRDKLNALIRFIEQQLPLAEGMINDHISDTDNPHDITADQLNAFSKLQFDQLMMDYLKINDTAYDATLFGAQSYGSTIDHLRLDIDASEIKYGLIPGNRLIGNFDPQVEDQYLTMTGWKSVIQLASTIEPIYYHGDSLETMYETFKDAPIDTRVTMTRLTVSQTIGYGNATSVTEIYQRETYKRTGPNLNDWTLIYY